MSCITFLVADTKMEIIQHQVFRSVAGGTFSNRNSPNLILSTYKNLYFVYTVYCRLQQLRVNLPKKNKNKMSLVRHTDCKK